MAVRRVQKFFLYLVFVVLLHASAPVAYAAPLFEDHFQGTPVTMPAGGTKLYPDPEKWAFTFWPGTKWPDSYGDGTNWLGNNAECQTYVTPLLTKVKGVPVSPELRYDPFSIQPDGLHIKASLLSPEQQAAYQVGGFRRFGSGMLLSRFSFTYGHLRMIAKLPSARGSWPALWLLPDSHQWPPEIDVFEGMDWGPHTDQIHTAILAPKNENATYLEWTKLSADPSDGFHEYGLDWTPDTVSILFDGKVLWQKPTPPSMHQPMYILANLAVGGKWPFNELRVMPIDSTAPERLSRGADLIQSDYPAELVIKSIEVNPL